MGNDDQIRKELGELLGVREPQKPLPLDHDQFRKWVLEKLSPKIREMEHRIKRLEDELGA